MLELRVAVVIPCYRVKEHILQVVQNIGPEVWRIYIVDDQCPQATADHVEASHPEERVRVLRNPKNLGVGGATIVGYKQALLDRADIVVKIDGDGQMDCRELPNLVRPLQQGSTDYAKGNRFYDLRYLKSMPPIRLAGNALLSFLTKLSSGYWNIMDPTNGYTAIHANVLRALELDRVEKRYFFESDLLYRLNLLRAVVRDVPMVARYSNEISSLSVTRAAVEFLIKNLTRMVTRIFYTYYLRDFQVGSLLLVVGLILTSFGFTFGTYHWHRGQTLGVLNSNGTVMLAALPSLIGLQFLLNFLGADINSVPTQPIHSQLPPDARPVQEPSSAIDLADPDTQALSPLTS